ncbi:MAG: hypothetical protein L0Z53_24665 [Acidobacteriales bacterium]|nr:hypothetical protein [Terriglobales bacterium]
MKDASRQNAFLSYFTLFTSVGTLVCCALPTLLVFLGLGAAVASTISAAPWLITISRHKALVFAFAGTMIALNFLYTYKLAPKLRVANDSCPVDGPGGCESASRASRVVLWISAVLFVTGLFAAYILPRIIERFT